MCCGANSHSDSRAIVGPYAMPTFIGKNSEESDAAVKTEWSYNYMTSYTFIM
jgi:hypothetical protein